MLSRRRFVQAGGVGLAGAIGLAGYAGGIEPHFRLATTAYDLALPRWPSARPPLRIAVVADLHAQDPWMPIDRIRRIVGAANRAGADLIVVLGDIASSINRYGTRPLPASDWSPALAALQAPLGVHAVLGNHDWWYDVDDVRDGIRAAGMTLHENDAVKIEAGDHRLWLAGLGDQWAFGAGRGVDDLAGTLARVQDDDPVVLLVHEPDIFVDVPPSVAVTLAGHTHGGQVALPFLGRPIVPSVYGARFAYGHVVEDGRHLVVSGGLGTSVLPVRLGVPPEITVVTVRGA